MASIRSAPVLVSAAIPANELSAATGRQGSTLRRVSPGQDRSGLLENWPRRVQNNLASLTCRGNLLDIHRRKIYGVQKHDHGDVLPGRGPHTEVASLEGDEPGAEELLQSRDDYADRFLMDLSWDPYLGEVTINEKVEEPPQYVPPPPIPAEDMYIRGKVESLLYTLEKMLPGQLDNDKADALCSRLSATVEVQNPAICFRGCNKCSEWLRALMQVQASINLHELYYENDVEDPDKREVYAVWTVRLLEHVHTNGSDLFDSSNESESTQLSGETMFEMETSGLVSRISSTWYLLLEDDEESFTKAKDLLLRLLRRTF